MSKLVKGDRVVMHTCRDAEIYEGIIWTCDCDEFLVPERRQNFVKLRGFDKPFKVKYLQRLKLPLQANHIPDESELREYFVPGELVQSPEFWSQVITVTNEERFQMILNAFKHFFTYSNDLKATTDNKVSLYDKNYVIGFNFDHTGLELREIHLGSLSFNETVSNDSKPFLIALHDLIVKLGLNDKVTLKVYYPQVRKILQDSLDHNLPVSEYDTGFTYNGERVAITVSAY